MKKYTKILRLKVKKHKNNKDIQIKLHTSTRRSQFILNFCVKKNIKPSQVRSNNLKNCHLHNGSETSFFGSNPT